MTDEHDPTGMRHLLAGLRETGPMPQDLNERIWAGLVQEQMAQAAATDGSAPDDSMANDSATGDSATNDSATNDSATNDADFWAGAQPADHQPVDHQPRRRGGAGRWILAAAAAAVLITGIGGVLVVRGGDGPESADSAGESPAAPAATSAETGSAPSTGGSQDGEVPAFVIASSGTDYSRSGLSNEAAALLADPESAPKNPDDSVLGTMSTAAGANDCLARLGHPEVQPVVLDVARFEGTPGVLIIAEVPPSGPARAWAVSTGCEPIWPGPTEITQD